MGPLETFLQWQCQVSDSESESDSDSADSDSEIWPAWPADPRTRTLMMSLITLDSLHCQWLSGTSGATATLSGYETATEWQSRRAAESP